MKTSYCLRLLLLSLCLLSTSRLALGQGGPARWDRAPAEGADVPKVSAQTTDGRTVDLSKPLRITVLVFGSHT